MNLHQTDAPAKYGMKFIPSSGAGTQWPIQFLSPIKLNQLSDGRLKGQFYVPTN